MIALPNQGRITQGTIFCGAYSEDYVALPIWGIVITARCDAAHEKTPIVNYVPLVRIEDWLKNSGGLIVIERALSDCTARYKSLLLEKKLSLSLLDVYEPVDIATIHFPFPVNPKESKKNGEGTKRCESRR